MSSSEPHRTPRPPLRRIASNYLCTPHGLLAHPLVETDAAGRIVSVTRCTDPDRLAATEYRAGILLPAFVDACDDYAPEYADGRAPEYADGHAPEYTDGRAPEYADGQAAGHTDERAPEYADGHAPEYADGHAAGHADERTPEYADGHAAEPAVEPFAGPAAELFFNSFAEQSADLPAEPDRPDQPNQLDQPTQQDQLAQPTQGSNDRRPSARIPIQRLRLSEFPIANPKSPTVNPEFPTINPEFPTINPEFPTINPEFQVEALLAAIRPDRRTMIVVDRPLSQPEIDCIAARSGAPVWWCLSFRLEERHFLRTADLLHRSGQLLCTGDGTPDRPDRLALLARLQRQSDIPLHRLLAWSTSCAAAAAGLPAGEVRAGLRCGVNQLSGIDYEHLHLTERSRIRRIV